MGRLQKSYSTCMECGGKMKMKSGGKWIQSAIKNPGSFTKQAQSAGMSVPAFKNKVLANKEDYSTTTVRRANLANTLSKMRKGQGGMDFKNPMAPDRMMAESDDVMENSAMMDISPLDNAVELLDPNMTQARQILESAEKQLAKQQEKDKVKAYQKMLNEKYGAGLAEDGSWGPKTQKAYEMYVKSKSTTPKMSTKDEAIFGSEKKPVRMEPINITAKPRTNQPSLMPSRPIPQNQPRLSDYLSKPVNTRSYSDNTRVAAPVRNMTTATTRFNQTQIGPTIKPTQRPASKSTLSSYIKNK
jgi:hypothetical protein